MIHQVPAAVYCEDAYFLQSFEERWRNIEMLQFVGFSDLLLSFHGRGREKNVEIN